MHVPWCPHASASLPHAVAQAFVERGVRPSAEALRLAEHVVPIMRWAAHRRMWAAGSCTRQQACLAARVRHHRQPTRCPPRPRRLRRAVVERPLWTPELHRQLPTRFRAAARELVMCLSRPTATQDGRQVTLSPDAVAAVLQRAAFPVSDWSDPAWLRAQTVRPPLARPAPAQQAGAAPGGAPAAQPGAGMPPFAQARLAALGRWRAAAACPVASPLCASALLLTASLPCPAALPPARPL